MNSSADGLTADQTFASANRFHRVLVAWDGSADSAAALRIASEIVGQSGHVVAFSVVASAPRLEVVDDEPEPWGEASRMKATFDAARAAIVRTSNARIDLHTAESRQVAGSICDYAVQRAFDLLVVGRHGEGGLMHPKLGHIAESAARSCKVPVLLVSA